MLSYGCEGVIMQFNSSNKHCTPLLLLLIYIASLSGCDQYDNLKNNPPKINSLDVPEKVQYGETVEFKVSTFDAEEDTLTYLWYVSDGSLVDDTNPIVKWIAPELPDKEVVPSVTVTVYINVRDEGEDDISQSASISVYSKVYEVANTLSGEYELLRTQVDEATLDPSSGTMRLTISTFTSEFDTGDQFYSGAYELVEPFDENIRTKQW